ncbi:MAG: sigma-54 dependent transcriptional regulator [Ignavibacteria bacterium]|nr:sigma-54 dependent transcriptional regulator [Ignavibacteria bacterium]
MTSDISRSIRFKIIGDEKSAEHLTWLFDTISKIYISKVQPDKINFSQIDPKKELFLLNFIDLREPLLYKPLIDLAYKFRELNLQDRLLIVIAKQYFPDFTELIRAGLNQIFIFPEDQFNLRKTVSDIVEKSLEKIDSERLEYQLKKRKDFREIIGESEEIKSVIEIAKKLSTNSNIDILILGETGTGKELLARTIHYNSPRAREPFVDITCSAIPENLLESEFFGHEKGSFTDAKSQKIGLFELAGNGSIFLDEIGDTPLTIQAKLLKAVENKVIRRIGGVDDIKISSRIIAATNCNLSDMVQKGSFRKDLFHRLTTISIEIPPLRERGDDVILLAEKFLIQANEKFNKKVTHFTKGAIKSLRKYHWPGNVRELLHVIDRAVLLNDKNYLNENDLIFATQTPIKGTKKSSSINIEFKPEDASVKNFERIFCNEVLKFVSGNKSKAAQILGISRPRLDRILKNIE